MSPMRRSWIAAFALLAACGRGAEPPAAGARAGEDGAAVEAPPAPGLLTLRPEARQDLRVTTAAAEERPAGERAMVLGEIGVDPERYGEASAPIEARIVRLLAAPGDRVAAGGVLAEMRSPEVGRARAAAAAAASRADLAARSLARKRRLADERIVAAREVQEAEAELAAAEAEVRAAEGTLAAVGAGPRQETLDANAFPLLAPVGGTVLERNAAVGEIAAPGRALFRVADLRRVGLTLHVFEREAVRVAPGSAVRVELAALPGRIFTGALARVGSEVDPRSRTVPVRVDLDNADGALRPGMAATAWIEVGAAGAPVVAVPAAALQRLRDGWCVFLPRAEGAFEVRSVGRGRDLGGEVEVVSGLAAGETVVVDGAFLLRAEAERGAGEGGHHDH